MLFTTEWLSGLFVDYKGAIHDSIPISEVTTDSRNESAQSLFIPIAGENFDGHEYIKEAFNNGAVAALWNKEKELPAFLPIDFPVFFVEDTLKALQQLASAYRDMINPIVIGITGSNGKTTTKDMMAAVTKAAFKTHYTKGNLNNHIGLPLTILSMPNDTEVLILEMGMNHFGEIESLSKIAKPDYAVITNIGESHIEYLGSREGITKAKLEITKGMKGNSKLLIDGDESLLTHMHKQRYVITCGFNAHNDVIIAHVKFDCNHTQFQLMDECDGYVYNIPLLGNHHALNATFAITVAKRLGITNTKINDALTRLEHTSMRFELFKGKNGISVINDAYNASPTSMKAAINVVKNMEGYKQKVLILGTMFELGNESKSFHRSVADSIDESIAAVFTYGQDTDEISSLVMERNPAIKSSHFTSKESLLTALEGYINNDTLILFKASRKMQFEWFVDKIIQPS